MKLHSSRIFTQLLKKDLISFRRALPSKLIDAVCLFLTNVIVFGYFMQFAGAHQSYASFFVVGAIASFGFIEIVPKVGILIADIQGTRTIYYLLGLPIKSHLLFCYIATSWAMTSGIISILLFPIGKLLVFKGLDLSGLSYPKLLIMFVTIQLFFGFFGLWLASTLKNTDLSSVWLRYIAPMWMFGGYTFSWEAAYEKSHALGAFLLINPMLYVMEGMRAVLLGQEGYLPFSLSITFLWTVIIACALHAIYRLKRKLDCI